MKKLSNYTEKELLQWYENTVVLNAKEHFKTIPTGKYKQGIFNNDYWNLYCYGEVFKAVYIKRSRASKSESESIKKIEKKDKLPVTDEEVKKRFSQSISRARSRVFELALCNEFKYFCTFTQDEKLRDRYNITEFRNDFTMFIRNLNRTRDDKIKYILIPEEHKAGGWHLHGLLMGLTENDLRLFTLKEKLPLKMRKKIKSGEKIYDWTLYRRKFGFFTCTEIKDNVACSKYITKYVSKDFDSGKREAGEHLFFASQGLKGREEIVRNCFAPCPFTDWDFENEYIKIKEFNVQNIGQ